MSKDALYHVAQSTDNVDDYKNTMMAIGWQPRQKEIQERFIKETTNKNGVYQSKLKTRQGWQLHSLNDKPAKIDQDGTEYWYHRGVLHRAGDKHAIFRENGMNDMSIYYKNGQIHREKGPAYVSQKRGEFIMKYYKNGNLHSQGDEPAVFHIMERNGMETIVKVAWYKNGTLHRVKGDKPALVDGLNGFIKWYKDGKLYRKGRKPTIKYIERPYLKEDYVRDFGSN